MYDFTYGELTDSVGNKHNGWFGAPLSFVEIPGDCDNNPTTMYWSGENIPGLGNIGPLPFHDPIAWKWDGDTLGNILGNINDPSALTTEPLCGWHTGPNQYAYIGAELIQPARNSYGAWGGTPHLYPPTCENEITDPDNSFYASCGTPKPFSTYGGGYGIGTGIQVNKKACWPEIMTVHKIECDDVGYKLHVSREYFEHDRIWTVLDANLYVPRLGLTTGGTDVYRNDCGDYNKECEGVGPNPPKDYSFTRPLITPSDTVAPLHPDLCATGTDVYFKTKTSYTGGTTDDTYSDCLLFPDISGQSFWNFYNLFEDSHPSQYQLPPDPPDCSESYPYDLVGVGTPAYTNKGNPVFSSVSQLKGAHSCFQDFPHCGGDLWCSKEFFPRRSYKVNTKITKLASLSICTQTSEFEEPTWYEGHGLASADSPNKSILATGPFIDACDPNVRVLAQSEIGIDDNIISIPHRNSSNTSDSILTLMGIIHPGFKADVNENTCIYAKSGECVDFLPKHTDRTIGDIIFSTDKYGYYLDKAVASGSHDCLFTPFKIMVDVECCPDRIGHRGTTDPTNLNYLAEVPSLVCGGWVADPPCDCSVPNSCDNLTGAFFPGLSCLRAIQIDEVELLGPCYDGKPLSPACSGEEVSFWYLKDRKKYLISTGSALAPASGGDPGDYFEFHESGYYSPLTQHCTAFTCDGGYDESGIPVGQLTGSYIDGLIEDETIDKGEDGKYYLRSSRVDYFASVFSYDGVLWRFKGETPEKTQQLDPPTLGNCCNCADEDEPGTFRACKGEYSVGCSCDYSVCDARTLAASPLASGTTYWEPWNKDDDGPGFSVSKFLNELGCEAAGFELPCSYPSYLKINISEDI